MFRVLAFLFVLGAPALLHAGEGNYPAATTNPGLVKEVAEGRRKAANAAWWGFDTNDATESLQAALGSGAATLTIPYMGAPWIVRPLQLPSNQEIFIEPGVVILAKRGEFQGPGDSLFTANNRSNLVIRGYGSCLRMNKRDYQKPPYKRAEWRMGVALHGCRHVLIEGLRVESTGGDGFYVDGGGDLGWSESVTLRDCAAYDNHRQGVSVISAVNLLIENCLFSSTWGTAPEAGIDLEPDTENQRFINCVIRNSVFENNSGHQILIYLRPLTTNSQPVSIRFENCLARTTDQRLAIGELGPTNGIKGVAGIAVGEIKDNGPKGLIEFIHCVSENTSQESVRIYDKSSASARVRFVDCSFGHPWRSSSSQAHEPHSPVLLDLRHPERTATFGGIDFIRCYVRDDVPRPAVSFEKATGDFHLHDVTGTLFVTGSADGALHLGANPEAVSLTAVRWR